MVSNKLLLYTSLGEQLLSVSSRYFIIFMGYIHTYFEKINEQYQHLTMQAEIVLHEHTQAIVTTHAKH